MLFSTKAEYGIRVLVELARHDEGVPISLTEIADHDHLPLSYLEHLVARLRRASLIESRRGAHGGYMLAKPAEEITMAEVVEALEGSVAQLECIAPHGTDEGGRCCPGYAPADATGGICAREVEDHACPTKVLWTQVQSSITDTLTQTRLSDLIKTEITTT